MNRIKFFFMIFAVTSISLYGAKHEKGIIDSGIDAGMSIAEQVAAKQIEGFSAELVAQLPDPLQKKALELIEKALKKASKVASKVAKKAAHSFACKIKTEVTELAHDVKEKFSSEDEKELSPQEQVTLKAEEVLGIKIELLSKLFDDINEEAAGEIASIEKLQEYQKALDALVSEQDVAAYCANAKEKAVQDLLESIKASRVALEERIQVEQEKKLEQERKLKNEERIKQEQEEEDRIEKERVIREQIRREDEERGERERKEKEEQLKREEEIRKQEDERVRIEKEERLEKEREELERVEKARIEQERKNQEERIRHEEEEEERKKQEEWKERVRQEGLRCDEEERLEKEEKDRKDKERQDEEKRLRVEEEEREEKIRRENEERIEREQKEKEERLKVEKENERIEKERKEKEEEEQIKQAEIDKAKDQLINPDPNAKQPYSLIQKSAFTVGALFGLYEFYSIAKQYQKVCHEAVENEALQDKNLFLVALGREYARWKDFCVSLVLDQSKQDENVEKESIEENV